ncbi:uncharacterized protein LOC118195599 [Stegodyphus dumicola]|uniref:uncharacterized protein LOC118195599 n=1 Tax=Stegodyphus dumicola TaxID=202533 RepID=UPI0015A87E90|nr:uncharacterized protein LOC118195599 [Stegodyphus dumicola]
MVVNLLLRLVLLPAVTLGEECTLYQLHRCLESLQSLSQGGDLALTTTLEELQAVCSTLKESVWCVDEHMKHCFTPTQRKVFNHVVAGARQFLLELCVPGPIQDAYLKHSPCYKNVSLSEEKCAPKYRHLIRLSENVDEQGNVDDGLRESCCAFNEFVLCKYVHVTQDCGQESADFLQQHLDRISSPLLHEHCAHYMYATDSCTSFACIHASPSIYFALILELLIQYIKIILR